MTGWARSGAGNAPERANVPAEAVARNWRREVVFIASLLGAVRHQYWPGPYCPGPLNRARNATSTLRFPPFSCSESCLWLDEPEREFVGGNLCVAGRLLARIGRIAKEIAFRFEHESRLAHFREDNGFVDAMQGFTDRDVGAGFGRMIDHDEMAAGFQRGEQALIHLGAVDG